jgi:hypothetical protein
MTIELTQAFFDQSRSGLSKGTTGTYSEPSTDQSGAKRQVSQGEGQKSTEVLVLRDIDIENGDEELGEGLEAE